MRLRRCAAGFTAASFCAMAAGAALADDRSDIDELKKIVEKQQREIESLKKQMAGTGSSTAELRALVDDLAAEADTAGLVQWKQITKGKSKFQLYGFVRL